MIVAIGATCVSLFLYIKELLWLKEWGVGRTPPQVHLFTQAHKKFI